MKVLIRKTLFLLLPLRLLAVALLLTGFGEATRAQEAASPKAETYNLPDPLVFQNGNRVKNVRQWHKKRRPELLELLEREMYGRSPGRPADLTFRVVEEDRQALGGLATRRQVEVLFTGDPAGAKMDLLLYLPNAAQQPVPAILALNFWGNHAIHPDPNIRLASSFLEHYRTPWADLSCGENERATEACRGVNASQWPVEEILSKGYALVTVYREDIASDRPKAAFTTGVHPLYPELQSRGDNFGTIAAWAWGLSRALDYLETDRAIDARRVAVFGWSRLGKAALWAGARDERFALVIATESGAGGGALSMRKVGEDVERLNRVFPHWFAANFRQYSNQESTLPFDQHTVLSLVAPRPVYLATAEEDKMADPYGEFLAAKAADRVYRFLGTTGLPEKAVYEPHQPVFGQIGFHLRAGSHDVTAYDWAQFLHFADLHLNRKR